MCLGTVAQVVASAADGSVSVRAQGRVSEATALTLDGPVPERGDWVVVHSGFVMGRISEAEAHDALSIRHNQEATS